MMITDALLPINEFSRSGSRISEYRSVIMHWVGKPLQTARSVRQYFAVNCPQDKHYSSVHYVVDFTGEILRLVPDSEKAYHCGSSQKDPISGLVYTDWSRKLFGDYASELSSPNNCTLGVELCTIDDDGNFRDATISAAVGLVSSLCRIHGIDPDNIGTHHMVVGWKDCPRLWVRRPELFDGFVQRVKEAIHERLP